jgi:hypothetical protein
MLSFYATYRSQKASIYIIGGAGRLALPGPRMWSSRPEGQHGTCGPSAEELFGFVHCCSFCAICHNMCKTNPIPQLRIGDFGFKDVGRGRPTRSTIAQGRLYEEPKRAEQTQFGPRRRVNLQNKAKLRRTGVHGQWQSASWLWPGRGVKCAKRTQFARPGPGSSKSEARNPKQIPRANDTYGGRQVKCEGFGPLNFGDWSLFRISRFVLRVWPLGAGGGCPRPNAPNEPNSARPGRVRGTKCAKQSQTWRDWGMWAKAVVGRGSAASETCETNPIRQRGGEKAGFPSPVQGQMEHLSGMTFLRGNDT